MGSKSNINGNSSFKIMKKTDKIKILAYAKIQTIVMAFVGLVMGLIYSIGGAIYDLQTIGINEGTALAFMAILIMPLYFAIFGFLTGIVGAFLYNLYTKKFSGINLNIKK